MGVAAAEKANSVVLHLAEANTWEHVAESGVWCFSEDNGGWHTTWRSAVCLKAVLFRLARVQQCYSCPRSAQPRQPLTLISLPVLKYVFSKSPKFLAAFLSRALPALRRLHLLQSLDDEKSIVQHHFNNLVIAIICKASIRPL
jgi:hypothetical protein